MESTSQFATPASSIRRLDRLYLERPPETSSRPYFQFVADHIREAVSDSANPTILDVGCANGAFLYFLEQTVPGATCTGIDALVELVGMARERVLQATFFAGDIRIRETLPKDSFDVVTMLTLHSHFDDIDSWLDPLLELVRPGGRALIFGPFNPNGVDVLVRLRMSGDTEWVPGWNMLSCKTFEDALTQRNLRWKCLPYLPDDAWPSDNVDPLRTRRATLNAESVLLNGAGLILSFSLFEICV